LIAKAESVAAIGFENADRCEIERGVDRASRRVRNLDRFPSIAALPSSANGLLASGASWSETLPARSKN
jgi:hypothetical protein